MLPAVERWGWIDTYSSLHPSSLSTVIRAMDLMLDSPEPVAVPVAAAPTARASRPAMSPEEEDRILARADELNARVAAILREYEDG